MKINSDFAKPTSSPLEWWIAMSCLALQKKLKIGLAMVDFTPRSKYATSQINARRSSPLSQKVFAARWPARDLGDLSFVLRRRHKTFILSHHWPTETTLRLQRHATGSVPSSFESIFFLP
jgi:hypothetical protein